MKTFNRTSDVTAARSFVMTVAMRIAKRVATSVVMTVVFTPIYAVAKEAPPANRISIEKARAAATTAYQGNIQDEELEFEGGKWIYSFDLKSEKDKLVHEVHVDAISGTVLAMHAESAKDEENEAIEDAKEK